MFHPTYDPKGMSDQELESKIKDAILKINQARRMNHENFYNQSLAIYNTLMLEQEQRKLKKAKEQSQDDSDLDSLINVS